MLYIYVHCWGIKVFECYVNWSFSFFGGALVQILTGMFGLGQHFGVQGWAFKVLFSTSKWGTF